MVRMNLPPHLEHLRKRVVHCGSGLGYALVTPLLAFAQGFALLGLALDVLSGAQGLEHLTALCAGEPPVGTDIWRGHTPDGQVKFPHPWPPQIPPGRTAGL